MVERAINQPPEQGDFNAFGVNVPLQEALFNNGAGAAEGTCRKIGRIVGSQEARDHAGATERFPPVLHRYDRFGNRIDQVERHSSWHWLVEQTVAFDLHGMAHRPGAQNAHAARAAMVMTWGELSLPTICPVSANYAMYPALSVQPEIKERWADRLLAKSPQDIWFAAASMTERQGGSDVSDTRTQAVEQMDGTYLLTGLKWFVTCPWAEVALVLGRTTEGLTTFILETCQPGFRIERLKDKLGWHPLGVGEVELREAVAHRVGEEGRGVAAIMGMIAFTRLDVMLEAAASMRFGVTRALHHCRHRRVQGRSLADHSAMRNVLTDLALESEAATVGSMRVARCYDQGEQELGRLLLTLSKYWMTKRAAGHAAEVLECFGGNGYVEASDMPRHLRDAVLGSIWEGSGNVAALDVLRTARKLPVAFDAFLAECEKARGGNKAYDHALDRLRSEIGAILSSGDPEWGVRQFAEHLALVHQANCLIQCAPNAVSDAFCAARLGARGLAYGTLADQTATNLILSRVLPE